MVVRHLRSTTGFVRHKLHFVSHKLRCATPAGDNDQRVALSASVRERAKRLPSTRRGCGNGSGILGIKTRGWNGRSSCADAPPVLHTPALSSYQKQPLLYKESSVERSSEICLQSPDKVYRNFQNLTVFIRMSGNIIETGSDSHTRAVFFPVLRKAS